MSCNFVLSREMDGARSLLRWSCVVVGSIGIVIACASLSWACVPQPVVVVQPSNFGPVGSKVTIEGLRFAVGPTEIRWGGLEGPLLATGMGPNISQEVTVPSAGAGLYSIVVFSRAADGSVGTAVQATAFEVTAGENATSEAPSPTPATGQPGSKGHSYQWVPLLVWIGLFGLCIGGGTIAIRRGRFKGRRLAIES